MSFKSMFNVAVRVFGFILWVLLASPVFGWLIAEVLIPGIIWYWNVFVDYWSNFPGVPYKLSEKLESWRI